MLSAVDVAVVSSPSQGVVRSPLAEYFACAIACAVANIVVWRCLVACIRWVLKELVSTYVPLNSIHVEVFHTTQQYGAVCDLLCCQRQCLLHLNIFTFMW